MKNKDKSTEPKKTDKKLIISDVSKSVCPKCGSTNWLYDNLMNKLSCEDCFTKF